MIVSKLARWSTWILIEDIESLLMLTSTFTSVLYDIFFALIFVAFSAFNNFATFSVYIEMFLQIWDLFEAFRTPENRARIGLLASMSTHMIEKTFDTLEKLSTMRLVTGVIRHCFWDQGRCCTMATLRYRIAKASLKSQLTEESRLWDGVSVLNII